MRHAESMACMQALDCTSSDEECASGTPSAFDQQKEAVVSAMFRLLVATAEPGNLTAATEVRPALLHSKSSFMLPIRIQEAWLYTSSPLPPHLPLMHWQEGLKLSLIAGRA